MTRAPWLLPLPLDFIAILTLRKPLPRSMPEYGLSLSYCCKTSKSFLKELYFLAKRLASFKKGLLRIIL